MLPFMLPLKLDATVEALGMADLDERDREMFFEIDWSDGEKLAVPLSQLASMPDADSDTQ